MAKIGVLGLGYVGIVNVACLSKEGHEVFCSDVKTQKVNQVQQGISPILEPEVDELLKLGIENKSIIPVENTHEVYSHSDVIMLCVGTPSQTSGEVNLSYLNNCCLEINKLIKPGDTKTIVFRSTVPPGTTQTMVEKYFNNKNANISCVFYPEFLREGTAVSDFYNYGRCVLGSNNENAIESVKPIFHINEKGKFIATDFKTAEFAKYADNSYHALKVAFANEIFQLAAEQGTNVKQSYEIFVADDKLNISPYYFKPGMPFGGSCLPKDLREAQFLTAKSNREYSILNTIIKSNNDYINALIAKIQSFKAQSIGFIGFTFKNHSDDLRESPVIRIIKEFLIKENNQIKIWDEDMNELQLRIDNPELYPLIDELENVAKCNLVVVTKRYLDLALTHVESKTKVLNCSDNPYFASADSVFALYV